VRDAPLEAEEQSRQEAAIYYYKITEGQQ